MHCVSVITIQNSGGSACCTVQIYRAIHAHLHSPESLRNDTSAHHSLTAACIKKSDVKLCADSWFMQDGLRKCHLSLLWEWFTELRLTVTDSNFYFLYFFGDQAMVQKLGEFILLKLTSYSQKMQLQVLLKCHKVALIIVYFIYCMNPTKQYTICLDESPAVLPVHCNKLKLIVLLSICIHHWHLSLRIINEFNPSETFAWV